jgi:hypothetical protein
MAEKSESSDTRSTKHTVRSALLGIHVDEGAYMSSRAVRSKGDKVSLVGKVVR